MGWSGARRVVGRGVVAVAIAVAGYGVVGGTQVLAGEHPSDRSWHSSDELLQNGALGAPSPILEVLLRYDADASPVLKLKQLAIKQGYAPQHEPVESGYLLSLLSATGDVLSALTFEIPNIVSNPPPQAGDVSDGRPKVFRHLEFALTVPMVDGAAQLQVADPQGLRLIQQSLADVPLKHNHPNFRSFRRHGPSSGSNMTPVRPRSRFAWLSDLLTETAEAATSDGTALDITFVGDHYTAADLTTFHQDVDRVISHLLTYEPYASRSAQVLFHSVDNSTTDLGCVHDATVNRLIVCNNATVTSVVNNAGAPYDKIIVLVNDPTYGGSGGSVAVSYNGSSGPQVAAHEFGHTFGGLRDEYNLYTTGGPLDGSTYANCYAGIPPDSIWSGLATLSDYTAGCQYPNWYRPSPCSVMLQLSCPYFNAVSQRQLNQQLDLYAGSLLPSANLSANPSAIGPGGSSTLSWTSANVTSCSASGAWSGSQPTSGSETVSPLATSTYTLTCSGAQGSATQSVAVTVDTQPPSVSLTSPLDGATVSGTVTIQATASDNQSVVRADFYKDGILLGSDNTASYSLNWNTSGETAGVHILTANAVDQAGNLGTSAPVSVTVSTSTTTTTTTTKRRGRRFHLK